MTTENNNVTDLDKKRDFMSIASMMKSNLGVRNIVIATVNMDGTFGTFIEDSIVDIELCYMIDCLKERRRLRNS